MRIREYPTQTELRNLFYYSDGNLIHKNPSSGKIRPNRVAGYKTEYGYIRVKVGGIDFQAHRLVWIWHNGYISPELEIDHIDRIRDNNRIENLRPLYRNMNRRNTKPKGYSYNKLSKRWVAQIMVNRKSIYLGSYHTEEAAATAYLEAKAKYHKIEIAKQRIEKPK